MSFKIRTKLFASFGIVLCLTAVIGYIGWANTVTFSSEFSHLYANNLRGAIALAKIERGLWELRVALPVYMLGDAAGREKIKAETPKWEGQVEEGMTGFRATPLTSAEQELLKAWDNDFPAYLRARPAYFALVDADKIAEAKEFRARATNPPAGRAVAVLGKLNELQVKMGEAREAEVTQTAARSIAGLGIALTVALALGGVVAMAMSRAITRPLRTPSTS